MLRLGSISWLWGLLLALGIASSATASDLRPAVAPSAAPAPESRPTANESAAPASSPNTAAVQPLPKEPPRRWSLTAADSQRFDWLTGKDRFDWPAEYNAKKTLGLPDWLSAGLEYRVRYETLDAPFANGQTGGQHQIPMQTVLWLEANYEAFRAGVEFWDARQVGTDRNPSLSTTMVDVADFTQIYGAWSTRNLFDSGLGFEFKGGRQTLDLGSRRLVARNAFRNTTNSFTGVLMRLRDGAGAWQVQAFGVQPVVRLPDDKEQLRHNDYAWDQEQQDAVFTGLFAEINGLPWSSRGEAYLYYLGEDADSSNKRRLFTPGVRWFRQAKAGAWDFEAESIAQTGSRIDTIYNATSGSSSKEDVAVEAFLEHLQLGYTFDVPWQPRLLLQYDYASGGSSDNGNTSHSFDTLFGARRWEYGPTGILGLFARNNISSPGTRIFVTPHRDVSSFLAYRAWWLADSRAAWQPANLVDPTGRSGDFIGHTIEFSTRWDALENISFEGGWIYLIKGDFAKYAPGAPTNHDNVNYLYVQTELRF